MDCGIAGVYLKRTRNEYPVGGAALFMYHMLTAIQNRGQQSAGLCSFDPGREYSKLRVHKNLGLVNEVFNGTDKRRFLKLMQNMDGVAAVGQVRYATSGTNDEDNKENCKKNQQGHTEALTPIEVAH